VLENTNQASTSTDHSYSSPYTQVMDDNQDLVNSTIPKQGIKRKFSTQRPDHAINATEPLVFEIREHNTIKREYYIKKLEL
jgi:hypothetical protein